MNSECGNVWGYQGSTGDVDWSWDYHIMMNEFRRHPQVCGWLYTEHHDVVNEWNGYYRYDRGEKETGLEELASGMSLRDLHAPLYVSTGSELCRDAKPGERVSVPLWLSFLTDSAEPAAAAAGHPGRLGQLGPAAMVLAERAGDRLPALALQGGRATGGDDARDALPGGFDA